MVNLPPANLNEASMPWARKISEFAERFEAGEVSVRIALDGVTKENAAAVKQSAEQQKDINTVKDVVAPIVKPRTPTKPLLASNVGSVSIKWDGEFLEEEFVPGFAGVSVQISNAFPGEIPAGGEDAPDIGDWVTVGQPLSRADQEAIYLGLPGEQIWVRLVAVNNSGVQGKPSEWATITVAYVKAPDIDDVVIDEITAAQDLAMEAQNAAKAAQQTADKKNIIWRQATKPPMTGNTVGDTWFNTSQGNQISRWDGTDWILVPFGGAALNDGIITANKLADKAVTGAKLADKAVGSAQLTDVVNQSITNAQATANAAQTAANSASTAATNAQTAANTAAATAAAIVASAENKILDPSLSGGQWVDTSGWTVDKTFGRTDTFSLKSGPTTGTAVINVLSAPNSNTPIIVPASAGEVWEVSGWYYVDDAWDGTPGNSKLRLGNQANALLGTDTTIPSNPTRNTWAQVTSRFTVPANGSVTGLRLTAVADNASGNVWWDDLSLRNVTLAVKAERDAKAAQDAADLAKAVADGAKTAADAAKSAADAAQSAANSAQTTANGKNRVIRSTAAASGTSDSQGPYVKGDQWWRFSSSTAIGFWIFDNGWQAQSMGTGAIATNAVTANELATAVTNNINKALNDSATAITAAGTAQTTADGKNTLIRSTAAASGTSYKNGDIWYRISGSQVIGMWIYANGWVQQTLTDSVITNLSAATITTGILGADRIGANTITTNKLVVGDFTNLIEDEDFDAALGVSWRQRSGAASASNFAVTTGLPGKSWKLDGVGTEVSVEQVNPFPVDPGVRYRFNARAQNQLTGTSPVAYVRFYWTKQDGTASSTSFSQVTIPVAGWADYSAVVTSPADAFYGRTVLIHGNNNTSGSWWIGRLSLRRMATAELIVDGAITAGSAIIANGAIGTAQIGDAAITNAKIADATITAAKIVSLDAGSITAGTIAAERFGANTISGTVIQGGTVTAANMAAGTITAASGIIANAAIGNAQIANSAITDAKILNGTITNASIADATITDAKIGNINAGKLTAGTIAADRFASNSISVSKLLVSNLTNLLEDPGFENTDLNAGWQVSTPSRVSRDTASPRSGNGALRLVNQSSAYEAVRQRVPIKVEPGQKFLFSAWVRSNKTTIQDGVELSVYHSNSDQAAGNAVAVARTPVLSTSYVQISGIFTVPAGSFYLLPRVVLRTGSSDTSMVYVVDDMYFQRMEDGSLIVDGAISATMISANALDGKVITGATIRTAASGQRLQLDEQGLSAYDQNGAVGARIRSAGGEIEVTGSMLVGQSGSQSSTSTMRLMQNRILFWPNGEFGGGGNNAISSMPPSNNINEVQISAGSAVGNSGDSATLYIRSGTGTTAPQIATNALFSSTADITTTQGALISGPSNASPVRIYGAGATGLIEVGDGKKTLNINTRNAVAENGDVVVGGNLIARNAMSMGTSSQSTSLTPLLVMATGERVSNWNLVNRPGHYVSNLSPQNSPPAPAGSSWTAGRLQVTVTGTAGEVMLAQAFDTQGDGGMWQRTFSGGSWGTWSRAGGSDTGWLPLTLNSGWSPYAGVERIYYKRSGSVVYLTGRVSGSASASTTIGVLPAGFRPADYPDSPVWLLHSDDGAQIGLVGQNGNVVCASNPGSASRRGVSYAPVSFPI